jgi:peptide/nickel transport system substrate-binding protein
MRRRGVALVILAFLAAGCTGSNGKQNESPSAKPGGTLLLAMTQDTEAGFDPAADTNDTATYLLTHTILRTLMSYEHRLPKDGGNTLVPDIATGPPKVSQDGLTWTFTLRPDVKYAPPLQHTFVTAEDFARAIAREFTPGVGGNYIGQLDVIDGSDAFLAGKADNISGITVNSPTSLTFHLSHPDGAFGYLLAFPAAAPIPPSPGNPSAPLGAATGHDKDWGRFMVATGPYMVEGADKIDYSQPASSQTPPSGSQPGRSLTLVRNPSWAKATDPISGNFVFVDRAQITIGGTTADLYRKVQAGDLDMVLDATPPPEIIQSYQNDPNLQPQLLENPSNALVYANMNTQEPPFDDLHFRRAMNFAIDKASIVRVAGGSAVATPATNVVPPNVIQNALVGYNPYPSPSFGGDLDAAKKEMAQSKYDSNGDGVCDASVCKNVLAPVFNDDLDTSMAAIIAQSVKPLGIELDVKPLPVNEFFAKIGDPSQHIPIGLSDGNENRYNDGETTGAFSFGTESIGPNGCCNEANVGMSAALQRKFGYQVGVPDSPNVDGKINKCSALPFGDARTTCWADFDRYMMEQVAPWVPLYYQNYTRTLSARVTIPQDLYQGLPPIEQMAVSAG